MTTSFDPYHKWLAIPPEEQPPNHYRLLGVPLFESDPDVIASAADRQMTHVRSFQTGRHSAASQKLLNEIAAARIVLLNSENKVAYDERLRQELAPVRVGEPAIPEPILPALPASSVHGTTPKGESGSPG